MMTDLVPALKGALDYSRAYRRQIFVIKVGGEVLADAEVLGNLAVQVALLESLSIRPVLVHGGGPQGSALTRQLGLEPRFVAGRRVTTPEVLEIAKMVYAGKLNVDLLAALRAQKVRAVGSSGVDGELITARRRPLVEVTCDDGVCRQVDYGEVGDIVAVDPTLLGVLAEAGHVPVIASLAADAEGRLLNINADTVAEALARALQARKLIFLTGAPGLLRDEADPASLIPFATPAELQALFATGAVTAGMRPKVEACLRAVQGGVQRTHIIDGRAPDALLIELFTRAGCGTMISGDVEALRYQQREL